MMKAVGLDADKIREDAKKVLSLIKDKGLTQDSLLDSKEGELAAIFQGVRSNRFFKYTDAFGVGLGRIVELCGGTADDKSFEKYEASLRWCFAQRMMQTWNEFTSDQLRMQGVEAMQKQLLIREKKRAASRLEKKAEQFEDKKNAILELNVAIEERRQQLIQEQKDLKKKFEPEAYERILQSEVVK